MVYSFQLLFEGFPSSRIRFLLYCLLFAGLIPATFAQEESAATSHLDSVSLNSLHPTGYGRLPQSQISSSLVSLTDSGFNQGNILDPMQLVQGRVAGLLIARAGGDPTQAFELRLRGISTLNGSGTPLILIDGLPAASLQEVDPWDVSRITVLKDASAAAIYGIRAANGVILVETRKGDSGKPTIQYNGFAAVGTAASRPDMLSAVDLRSFYNRLSQDPNYQGQLEDFQSSTDWQQEIMRSPAFSHAHQLALSGSNKVGTHYRASLSYRNTQGLVKSSGLEQLNGRLRLYQRLWKDRIHLDLNLAYNIRDWQNFDYGFENGRYFFAFNPNEPIRQAVKYNPTAPVRRNDFLEYGGYFQALRFDMDNPVAILNQTRNEYQQNLLSGRFAAQWKITEGLTARASYAAQSSRLRHGFDALEEAYSFQYGGKGAVANEIIEGLNWMVDASLSYEKQWKSHGFQVMGGYAYQYQRREATLHHSDSLPSATFRYPDLEEESAYPPGFTPEVNLSYSSLKLAAFFGRASYQYRQTYFFAAQLRREGASSLGTAQRWGTFYGINAGWDLARYWAPEGRQQVKLRLGYGVTGNLPMDNNAALPLLETESGRVYYNGQFIPGSRLVQEENPNLKWEETHEWNLGVDFRFWKDRVTGSLEFYRRRHSDLLTTVRMPFAVEQNINRGKLQNQGMEASLTVVPVVNSKFRWELGQVLTFQKTTLLETWQEEDPFYGPTPGIAGRIYPVFRFQEGESFAEFFGPVLQSIDSEGKWVFRDLDRDGQTESDWDDFTVLGQALPKGYLGHWQRFRLGAFDLEFMLRAVWGHDMLNYYRFDYENPQNLPFDNLLASTTEGNLPSLRDFPVFSSFYVEDAGFVRLDYLTLGYTHRAPGSKWLEKIRVYCTVQNLFTLTGYQGLDPELRFTTMGDPLAPGLEREYLYYPERTFLVGVKIGIR